MVRHHVKKSKKGKGKAEQTTKEIEVDEEDLERFAGSSDEEAGDFSENSDEEGSEDEGYGAISRDGEEKGLKEEVGGLDDVGADGDDDDSDADAEDGDTEASIGDGDGDDEEEEVDDGPQRPMGMAGAMSRILESASAVSQRTGKKTVILSKTKTKEQKAIEAEEKDRRALKKKRQERRKKNLSVMFVPGKGTAEPKAIEAERALRRIATRGVVALFNAIAAHQHEVSKAGEGAVESVGGSTKKGFVDNLKERAVGKEEAGGSTSLGLTGPIARKKGSSGKEAVAKETAREDDDHGESTAPKAKRKAPSESGSKWLSDDYLMKSKLKDWDKDSSDSSEDEVPDFVKAGEDDLSDAEEYDAAVRAKEKKRENDERRERKSASKKAKRR
mmetsp:Transcript_10368/g.20628  ORF Transcript_10368/g.20628 Transcript_10368/m.20628 type:complete len:387 (+) Transcript_10368:95-1255(+)